MPHPRLLHYTGKMLLVNATKTKRNWCLTFQPDNYLQFTKEGTRRGMDEHLKLYSIFVDALIYTHLFIYALV